MVRCALLFLYVSFHALHVAAQEKEAYRDSLRSELSSAHHDTTTIQLYNDLADSYWLTNYDSGLYYAQESLLMARRIEFRSGEVNALIVLANLSGLAGDNVRSYNYANEAAEKAVSNEEIREINQILVQGLLTRGEFEEALRVAKANTPLSKEDDIDGYCVAGVYISDCFVGLEQFDSADWYMENSYAIMKEHELKMPYVILSMGDMYYRRGELSKSVFYWREAISYTQNEQVELGTTRVARFLSRAYQKMGNRDSSIYYAELSLESAIALNSERDKMWAYNNLSLVYQTIDSEKALEYSLSSFDAANKRRQDIQQASFDRWEDFDQRLEAIEKEKAQEEADARIRTNALLGSSFTLLVIAFFLYRNNRNKQKAKKQIESAYEQLKNTQSQLVHSEKMASLGELTAGIAHEIQNPLNFVNNFSDLNKELIDEQLEELDKGDIDEAKAIANDIKANEVKITHHGKRAEQIVKSMLQHSRTGSGEKELTDINALADEYLRLAYHGLRAKDQSFNADFKTELDPAVPKIEVVPQDIGRVLLNLINNAFQAIADIDQPEVVIKTEHLFPSSGGDQGEVQITVSDNGPGIPDDIKDKIFQPFFTTKPTGEGTGLGLSMSYDIVTKGHGGTLEMKSEMGKGTKFIVTLPM